VEDVARTFAYERFRALAKAIIVQLKEMPATGIYEGEAEYEGQDEAEDEDESTLTSLWDEYRYEQETGPREQLERALRQTIQPFLEAAVDALSEAEQRLLSLATDAWLEYDDERDEIPPLDPEGVISEVASALREAARRR
jgi:hypothetical protein